MFFRRDPYDDDYRRPPDRSWPTRLAWSVLVGGAALLVLRCSFATVVEIHGDGMIPNLRSGDHVLFVRGTWGLDRGDLVVYDPTPPAPEPVPDAIREVPGDTPARDAGPRVSGPRDQLRNTAVVDAKELGLDDEWQQVQRRSGVAAKHPPRSLRVARILALPGDTITFGDPRGALGLAINDEPLAHKPGDAADGDDGRLTSFENIGDRRYQVLASTAGPDRWPGMRIPADGGPYEMTADGFLLVADNRDEGACCDSRAIGWVDVDQLRGEIMLRLGGAPDAPDQAP